MKFVRTTIFALLVAVSFTACKKDNDVKAPFTIEGLWEGNTNGGGYFGINVVAGGTLERLNGSGSVVATGHWELNGTTLSGDYHFPVSDTEVTFSAEINSNLETLSGTWSNDGGELGTMTATKSNN
jgi:hypothetical protein